MSWRLQNGSKPSRGPPVGHKAAALESNLRDEALKAKERVRNLEQQTKMLERKMGDLQKETDRLKDEIGKKVEDFLTKFRTDMVDAIEEGVPGVKVSWTDPESVRSTL